MMFIGRNKELKELNKRFDNNRKEFGLIYGRRRIGKTALISEFIKDKKSLIYQAKSDSYYGNLKSFSFAANKFMNKNQFVYSSYEEMFDEIISYVGDERFIFCIDEYPYIVNQDPSFPSILQEFIDHAPNNFFIILSGSDVSFLKKEIMDHESPLYKRKTFEMEIKKLPFDESSLFVKDISNFDKCAYLGIFHSSPYYLAAIDYTKSFKENLTNLLFNEYGIFFELPDQLLSNSTKVQDIYNAILCAIAHHKQSVKDISIYIHEEEAKTFKYLNTLLNSELVIKNETFMGNKKSVYYSINDTLLLFWYTFIYENQERIKFNGDLVYNELEEKINLFISKCFENISILYLYHLNSKGKLGNVYDSFKTFKADKSILNRSVEIDAVGKANNNLLIVECKYRNTPFTLKMLEHLEESASILPSKYNKQYYIFSKIGFDKDISDIKKDNIHLITLDDMFNM